MHQCPKCKSSEIQRSRSRNKWETWRKEITGKRVYRCSDCGWRGWGPDSGPQFNEAERALAERLLASEPPNLKGTELSPEAKKRPDLNLNQLDSSMVVNRRNSEPVSE